MQAQGWRSRVGASSADDGDAPEGPEGSRLEGSQPAAGKVEWLRVDSLLPADSPRLAGECAEHLHTLAQVDAALPPIVVHRQTMRVIDGMHRLRVAATRGQQTIAVTMFDGSSDDAFVVAVAANRAHGLPLTLADREAAAERILRAQGHRSDRSIAVISGLSASTVGEIRRRIGGEDPQPNARIGRDGRVRPLNAREGRRVAAEVIARRPEASLRDVARAAGISVGTARDVRARIRRGDDLMPAKQRAVRPELPPPAPAKGREDGWCGAQTAAGRDRAAMLRNLSSDPSLRFSESGRNLLHWLHTHAAGPTGWEGMVTDLPPHCAYVLADLASACAREWSLFAIKVQEQLQDSA